MVLVHLGDCRALLHSDAGHPPRFCLVPLPGAFQPPSSVVQGVKEEGCDA